MGARACSRCATLSAAAPASSASLATLATYLRWRGVRRPALGPARRLRRAVRSETLAFTDEFLDDLRPG